METPDFIEKTFSDSSKERIKYSTNEELIEYVNFLEKQLEKQKEEIEDLREKLNISESVVNDGKELIYRILESLPFPAYIKNSENKILITNKALLELIGKSSEEVIGKAYVELFESCDIKANHIIEIEKNQTETIANDIEAKYIISAIRKESQISDPLGISCFSDNISFNDLALTKAKVDITNEKKLFEAVMGALPVGVAIIDKEGCILRTNEMFDLIWRKTRTEANSIDVYTNYIGFWLGSDKEVEPHEWASYKATHENKAIIGQLIKIKRFDGTEAVIINSATPVINSDGKTTGSAVAIQDISFYIKTEEALHISEQRFHSLFNSIDEGFSLHQIVYNSTGNVNDFVFVEVNPAFERITGLKNEDIQGKTCSEVLPADNEFWKDIFTGMGINEEPRKIERHFTSLNKIFQLYIYSPAPNQYATLFFDITEQKKSELRIQRQNSILQGINHLTHDSITLNNEDEIKPLCLSVIENLLQSKSGFLIKCEHENNFKELTISTSGNIILRLSESYKDIESIINFEEFNKKEYNRGFYSNNPELIATFFKLPENHQAISSIICMPLIQNDKICGIIGATNKPGGYTIDDLDILDALSLAVNQTLIQIKTKNALLESEEKYRLLFNKMVDGFTFNEIILDSQEKPVDYKFLSVNPAFERQTGHRAKDIVGKKASEVMPASEQYLNEVFGAVALTGENIEFEYFRKTTNRYYKVSTFSTRLGYFAVIYNDITNKKIAEIELRKTKNYLENLLNHSNSPIVVWNTKFEIQLFNNAFEHLTGYLAEEVTGRKIDCLFPENSVKSSKESIKQLLSGTYWESVELPIYCKNEETRFVLWSIANIYDSDNKTIVSIIAQGNDITERKKTLLQLEQNAKELHELNATKDKFFGIIAHDLKNPFSSILAASEILANNFEKFERESIKKFSNVINSSANSAHILLENLLEWSRSQTGYIKFNPQYINLKELVQKNIFCFEATAVNKKIIIIPEIGENICITADKNMLNTILRNLINNALKFTYSGGTIKIKATLANDEIIISVKDTGIGIKKADIQKLFRIDIKYTNIGTANERGTGLGLILCREFVEKHGGKIWVESKVGKGSEFKFSIPLITIS